MGRELETSRSGFASALIAVERHFAGLEEAPSVIHLKRHAGAGIEPGNIAARQSRQSAETQGKFIGVRCILLREAGRGKRR